MNYTTAVVFIDVRIFTMTELSCDFEKYQTAGDEMPCFLYGRDVFQIPGAYLGNGNRGADVERLRREEDEREGKYKNKRKALLLPNHMTWGRRDNKEGFIGSWNPPPQQPQLHGRTEFQSLFLPAQGNSTLRPRFLRLLRNFQGIKKHFINLNLNIRFSPLLVLKLLLNHFLPDLKSWPNLNFHLKCLADKDPPQTWGD